MGSSAGPLTDAKRGVSVGSSAEDWLRPAAGDSHLLLSSVTIFNLGAFTGKITDDDKFFPSVFLTCVNFRLERLCLSG